MISDKAEARCKVLHGGREKQRYATTVGLYLQSETLRFLPPLDSSLLAPTKLNLPVHYVLASDQATLPVWRPGRGSGSSRQASIRPLPRRHSYCWKRTYGRTRATSASALAGWKWLWSPTWKSTLTTMAC